MPEIIEPMFETPEQIEAIKNLQTAMETLMGSVIDCNDAGIPLADAFALIGMEIPLFVRPLVNQMAEKLPKRSDMAQASLVTSDT